MRLLFAKQALLQILSGKSKSKLAIAKKNIGWILPLTGLTSMGLHILLLHNLTGLAWEVTMIEGEVNSVLIILVIWLIVLFIKNYPTQVGAIVYGTIIATALSILITYTAEKGLAWWYAKQVDYQAWLKRSQVSKYIIAWLIFVWVATCTVIKKRGDSLEDKFVKYTDAANLLRDAELFKLRQQLQPHFLYNSLNSISALVMIQPDKAQEMIGKLSDFLRSSVKREAEDRLPVNEELVFIEAYLSIEAVRFGDRLDVDFAVAEIDRATIPPFLLQPLLENAIKFGLYGKTGNVNIRVSIKLENEMLSISISNPYDPETNPPKGTGFGIQGIRRRLELLYARTDLLEVTEEDNTFTTTLKIPQSNA